MFKALFLAGMLALAFGGSIATATAEPPDPCLHGDFGE